MNLLIFGATGRTGEFLVSHFSHQSNIQVIPVSRALVDVTDETALNLFLDRLSANPPTAIINAAALSSLEGCLEDSLTAHQINTLFPEKLAQFCRRTQIKFIHLSTDYVLDGRKEGLKTETAKCYPLSIYGESKYEAELRLTEIYPEAVIARVSWIYGNPHHPAFAEQVLNKLLKNEQVSAIEDKDSLPTSVHTIALAIKAFLNTPDSQGIYHVCDSGNPCTWKEYAQEIAKIAYEEKWIPTLPLIKGQKLNNISFFKEARPLHTAMDNTKLQTIQPIPHWKEMLRYTLQQNR